MYKRLSFFLSCFFSFLSYGQWAENTTPTYPELIEQCRAWANQHEEIELYAMGPSDYGLPIYVFIVNGAGDSLATFEKARQETTILVNNAIHPGEPDGINAMLLWTEEWISKGKKTKQLPLIAFVPAYNVGGMMNRSSTSRANQDGPMEYGFRGNAQNLDLNRDFIKMDSRNAFTFTRIFQGLNPDVFIDNHVSNGADYQHVLTLISAMKERLAPSMRVETYEKMLPAITKSLAQHKIDLVPYVDLIDEIPDKGLVAFNDLPRYANGYASLFNCFSFTVETHMLKPFPDRVQATKKFFEAVVAYCVRESKSIEKAREDAFVFQTNAEYQDVNFTLDKSKADSLTFKGYAAKFKPSEVTGLDRLYYDRNEPWIKKVPYYNSHVAQDSLRIPKYFVVGGQEKEVIERLAANGIVMNCLTAPQVIEAEILRVVSEKNRTTPYENHFLHTEVKVETEKRTVRLKVGDYIIPTEQQKRFFLLTVLFPQAEDSYFAWNFFDSYLDEKEYFSPYVFEDIAARLLDENPDWRSELEAKKQTDPSFAASQWRQLYFVYERSTYFEPTYRVLPVYLVY